MAFVSNTPLSPSSRPQFHSSLKTITPLSSFFKSPTTRRSHFTCVALSADVFRAAAAAATITFANVVYPTRDLNQSVNAQFQQQEYSQQILQQRAANTTHSAHNTVSTVVAVTGVGKSSLHDYRSSRSSSKVASNSTSTQQQFNSQSTSISKTQIASTTMTNTTSTASSQSAAVPVTDPQREFMLATRLTTAVMMGVMLGVERRATTLNLGVRSVTVISVTSALLAVVGTCCESLLPATTIASTTSTTASSAMNAGLAFVIANGIAPAATVVALAALSGMCVFIGVRMRTRTRSRLHRRSVPFARSMSAVVGLVVGMGVACGAGLGLMTAGFYLGGVAVMRGERTTLRTASASASASGLSSSNRTEPLSRSATTEIRR